MDTFYRPTWAEISLDALRHNVASFRRLLPNDISLIAVVKADAYGHGAIPIAREALASGAGSLAVASFDEALELRMAGIDAPILVLGYSSEETLPLAAEHRITLAVYTDNLLDALAKRMPEEGTVRIQIKIDTGMGRIGVAGEREAIAFIERALNIPSVRVEGLFTHYACADQSDKTCTRDQYSRFERIIRHFEQRGVTFPLLHAGNSAAAIDVPELAGNAVRLGISMYGLYPSANVNRERIGLEPVMSLKTRVVMLKELEAGSGVSYGHKYRTAGREKIATLPIGYADGFSRMRNGKAEALIRGRRVPVVGVICMDQCMINVSGIEDAAMLDEVTLLGRQGDEMISAGEWAAQLGTIEYEVPCMITRRVPRVYIKDGQIVDIVNRLSR